MTEGESDSRDLADLEVLVWDPARMPDDEQIDSFLIMTRCVRLPSLVRHVVMCYVNNKNNNNYYYFIVM